MQPPHALRRSLAAIGIAVVATCGPAAAQQAAKPFEPQVGQRGKDVVWVPTAETLVERMLDMAKVTSDDYVIDLGSGDGRTVIAAAKRGAKALGIEYNPDMVALSKKSAEQAGVTGKASFMQGDIFATDFSRATVLTLFLLPEINLRLRPTILRMKPGTRVVSNSFDMGDWKADETAETVSDCRYYCRAMLWIVPARVEGAWRLGDRLLELEQTHQVLAGTLRWGNVVAPVKGRLKGAEIAISAGDTEYRGQVKGEVMAGSSKAAGKEAAWQATRAK